MTDTNVAPAPGKASGNDQIRERIIHAWCVHFGATKDQVGSRCMEGWRRKVVVLAHLLRRMTGATAPELRRSLACSEKEAMGILLEADEMLKQEDPRFIESCGSITSSLDPAAAEQLEDETSSSFTIARVAKVAARSGKMELELVRGPKRPAKLVRPRQVGMYLACCLVEGASLQKIAAYYGGRDHSSVVSARNKVHAIAQGNKTDEKILDLLTTSCAKLGVELKDLRPKNMRKE